MKQRILNADLVRCVAVFSVFSVHFLLNTGFYSEPVEGPLMLWMCMVRSLFMVCVPLFMILSGYLMLNKSLSRKYYSGLIRIVSVYLAASILCLLFKKYHQGKTVTVLSGVLDILDFNAANYSWYVEMYLSLFLMIPFLNLAWHGLKDQRQKRVLVLTMAVVTFLPKMLNNFNFETEGWWASPSSSDDYNGLVPGFFTAMYPITYYFIGAYLREFPWRPGRLRTLFLFLAAVAAAGCYNYYRSDGGKFVWASNSTWGGENLITASLLFTFLLQLHPERLPRILQTAITAVSKLSFGMYLLSWIFDRIVYDDFLKPSIAEAAERWKYYPAAVSAVFLLSLAASALLTLLLSLIGRASMIFRLVPAADSARKDESNS